MVIKGILKLFINEEANKKKKNKKKTITTESISKDIYPLYENIFDNPDVT